MLKNIKSLYFTQIIFTYVNDAQKLKIIKYNKSLQKIIHINIINYKHFSRRYIKYELNGIGKEYNGENESLIFEGEYLNGQRNGKGKEYWRNNRMIFEGKYLNGKRNGKGREYDFSNSKLIFEGEYINGKRNGKGKEYWSNGILFFEGEYLNNKQWIGIGYNSNGNILYSLNNDIIGKGREYNYYGKLIFEGDYLKGKRNGKGKDIITMVH